MAITRKITGGFEFFDSDSYCHECGHHGMIYSNHGPFSRRVYTCPACEITYSLSS